ncbi:neuroglian-like isoform X1 [Patella vulgata]|uniref:neuroglian-like isoform X1 n=1 Tax=Patella vulgata TaxID=6465 RepID=UPI0024A98A18|nr:neuroglian-like isoform X1 [Patella vulgata]
MTCQAKSVIRENPPGPPEWFENGAPIPNDKFDSGKYVFGNDQQILKVTNLVKPDDTTCFQCKVTNSEGFRFADGCLDVIEPIVITSRPPAVQEILKGDIVNLTVMAQTNSPWPIQYKWLFNNQTYDDKPPFVTYNETSKYAYINTEDLSFEDYRTINGTYIRMVYNVHEKINVTIQVILKEVERLQTPKITEPDVAKTIYYKATDEVILVCQAEANPQAQYEWMKDGQTIVSDFIKQDPITGELQIASLTRRETGKYQCFASNQIGTKTIKSMSPIITVDLAYLNSWVDTPRIQATEGEAVQLTCDNVPLCNPPGQFKWYKGDDESSEVVQDDRIAIDAEGTLHFVYVTKADDLSGLKYQCAIFNRHLNSINLGRGKILEITKLNPIPDRAPSVLYSKPNQKALIGHYVDIQCIFGGKPIPSISWKNNELQAITSNSDKYEFIDTSRQVLRVKNIQESDEGTFTCEGANTQTNTATTALNVTSRPIWEKSLSSITVAATRDASMTCQAKSVIRENPPGPPEWFENGAPIPNDKFDSGKYVFSNDKQILMVTNLVKPDDTTCFQCKVTNSEGFRFADGCLDVIEPIVITSRPPAVQEILKGDIVNLTVMAQTNSPWPIQYKWFFNNQTYDDKPPFVTYNETSKYAYINTKDLSFENYRTINGTYIRMVYNVHEKINVTIQVILKEVGNNFLQKL